jgi:hypothetical protein
VIRREVVAQRFQLGAQRPVIENLTVEHHRDRAVRIPHWLKAAGGVDHDQPAMAQKDRGVMVTVITFPVRSAMDQGCGHSAKNVLVAGADESG